MKIVQPRSGEPIRVVVTKAGQARYRVTLDGEPYPDGRRRQIRSTHDTLTKARAHVDSHRTDRERGTLLLPDRQTFAEYAINVWLVRKQRSARVREKTALGYKQSLNHPIAAFGGKAIAKVTRADVERMTYKMADAGRAQSTVTLALFVVRSVLDDAVEEGLLARNPATRVQPLGRRPKLRAALTPEQIALLRARFATDRLYACWLLTLCGLRRSEVMGLRWRHIDFERALVKIEGGRVLVDGKRTSEGKPKTERGARELPLTEELVAALRLQRAVDQEMHSSAAISDCYIAVDETGLPLRPDRWSNLWSAHCAAVGIKGFTLHAARHSSVTAMRDLGVPDHVVAAWHGHDEHIMRRVYSHAHNDGLEKASEALNRVLHGSSAGRV